MKKTYKELRQLQTYKERLEYLQTANKVGEQTFGGHRWMNQKLYSSPEWKTVRNQVILRDKGCDMGLEDYEIQHRCYIHHINPITVQDMIDRNESVLDPENLITVSFDTHQKIHYGNDAKTSQLSFERKQNDTCPWRK